LIDYTTGFPAFTRRSTSEPAWHNLGGETPADAPLEVWAANAGINFEYVQRAVWHGDPSLCYPNRFVLVRSDTNAPLSIVSDKYRVVQPKQVLEFYRDLVADQGFVMETAGALKDGARVWALANTGEAALLSGVDAVKGYLLFVTSCDGEMSTQISFVNTRVVCNNTLAVAVGEGGAIRIPHLRNFVASDVKAQLGLLPNAWSSHIDTANALTKRQVSDNETRNWLLEAVGDPTKRFEEQNTHRMNRIHQLFSGAAIGSGLVTAKGTAWGLVNAVTEFVDYYIPARSTSSRLNSSWTGDGGKLKQRAWSAALKLIDGSEPSELETCFSDR